MNTFIRQKATEWLKTKKISHKRLDYGERIRGFAFMRYIIPWRIAIRTAPETF